MKIQSKLVEWLLELDPATYATHVVIKKGAKVLHVEILCTIYGMLEASLLWYRKFRTDLEEIKFYFNVYDPCVASQIVSGKQHTVRFHVHNIILSHVDKRVNDHFVKWADEQYGKIKSVEVKRRKPIHFWV